MQAYDRTASKRAGEEAIAALWQGERAGAREATPAAGDGRGRDAARHPGLAAALGRLAGPGDALLASLALCARYTLVRSFGCGCEDTVAPWCGSPLCVPCATARAARASAGGREAWDARVLTVSLPLGAPGGLELPDPASVAAAREAWGRAAREVGPDLERVPRAVLTPDGLVLFARVGEGPGGRELEGAVERACARAGLRGALAVVLVRDVAAARLGRALRLEAERFAETLCAGRADDVVLARARRRLRDRRRATVVGAASALAVDVALPAAPAACPVHAQGCASVRVLDGVLGVRRALPAPGPALLAQGRAAVVALLTSLEPAPAALRAVA